MYHEEEGVGGGGGGSGGGAHDWFRQSQVRTAKEELSGERERWEPSVAPTNATPPAQAYQKEQ